MSAEPQFPGVERDTLGIEREAQKRHLSVVPPNQDGGVGADSSVSTQRALVPQAQPRTRRLMMIVLFASVPLILVFVLLVNIFTASKQYDLVDLRTQEVALMQQNEALAQEIAYYQAPQDLAMRASQLGLVSTQAQATINLQTGEVTGTPVSAAVPGQEDKKTSGNLIPPPALYDTEAYATGEQREAEHQKKLEEARKKAEAEKKKQEEEQKKLEEQKNEASATPSASPSAR